MATEIKIPAVGESITEVQIGTWLKKEGDAIKLDEPLVTVESDKATVEVNAPVAGFLSKVAKHDGDPAIVGEVIAYVEAAPGAVDSKSTEVKPAPAATVAPASRIEADGAAESSGMRPKTRIMPSAQRAMAEHGVRPDEVTPTGPGGRLLKEDVMRFVEGGGNHDTHPAVHEEPPAAQQSPVQVAARAPESPARTATANIPVVKAPAAPAAVRADEEIVRMSPMRRTIAARLVEAQQTAALLTTFNEIDMSALMAMRKKHQEAFQQRYGIKLGLMSFFVKATVDALKLVPQINAEVRGDSIVFRNHYDVGVAVGGGKGLVVPVLRDAEHMSFSQIERTIADFGKRAKENKIELAELQGGTFTISNGGIYGSLLSTPIVNPPQSGILGLHAIQDRPIALEGQVVIRPMMYVAVTYDHRIVDGREAVTFLKRIKECIEDPARLLIET